MNRIPVDANRLEFTALQVLADADGEGVQKDRDGVPLWKVECLVRPREGRATVELVKVPARTAPTLSGVVMFTNLVARPWTMGDRNGVTLAADAVAPVRGGE